MKRKLLPLLGIAFVVAVVSTGIFYGLLSNRLRSASSSGSGRKIVVAQHDLQPGTTLQAADVVLQAWGGGAEEPKGAMTAVEQAAGQIVLQPILAKEPVTGSRLASTQAGGAALAVPAGMRAVSIRVTDSSGVVGMLRPGHKVDVQAVRNLAGGESQLRTLLQEIEVLNVTPPEGRSNQPAVATLLVKPGEADMVSLADAGGRIRLVLRNPVDGERPARPGLLLAKLFQDNAPLRAAVAASRPRAQPVSTSAAPPAADPQILLRVRIAGAAPAALEQLDRRLASPRASELIQVAAFRAGWDLEKALGALEASRSIEILSASYLRTGPNRQVSVQAGAQWKAGAAESSLACGIRIQFLPSLGPRGTVRLRVQPEVTAPRGESITTRRIETEVELASGQSFLVAGLIPAGDAALWERLFPEKQPSPGNRELLVLVTPELGQSTPRQAAAWIAKKR